MSSEQRGFVFSVTFIMLFSVLIATIPAGLQGPAETPDMVTPLNPSIIAGFSDSVDFNKSDFWVVGAFLEYIYDLGGRTWICDLIVTEFFIAAKVLLAGFLWLGATDSCKFISPDGEDRGQSLSFTEIADDAPNGTVQYNLQYIGAGSSAGGFVLYWNTTTYSNPSDAWDNSDLYLLHGQGIEETASADIGSLLVSLLFLQLPDVPLLINFLLVVPIWASIIFILWYIIKEMIPFV